MKRNLIYVALGSLLVIGALYFFFASGSTGVENNILATVEKGEFRVEITTSGELEALRSVQVFGPAEARRFRIGSFTIDKMVDEGTVVQKEISFVQ